MKYTIALLAILATSANAWDSPYTGSSSLYGGNSPIYDNPNSVYNPDSKFGFRSGGTYITPGQPTTYRYDFNGGSMYLTPGQPTTYQYDWPKW